MRRVRPYLAAVCTVLLLVPSAGAADPPKPPESSGVFGRFANPYRPADVPPVSLGNSGRLDALLRAGKLYLSLDDTIALALENNLDLEIQRYVPLLASASVQRTRAGSTARSVSTSVLSGPASATGTTTQAAALTSAVSTSTTTTTTTGPALPALDPTLTGSARWGHTSTPQSSTFTTGTNSLVQRTDTSSVGIQQGFLTGSLASLSLTNTTVTSNNRGADFVPATSATLGFTFTQHLLQGFGVAVNNRQMRIAKNNREIGDLTFKLQVITTVAAVMELYWDLVSFTEDARVKRAALTASEKLYGDNKKQVEIGTLAPIEIVRAEAEVASRQQDLTVSETRLLQQETILKNALSRNGVSSPSVAEARIVPTDRIRVPDVEAIQPVQDLVATALAARPELGQSRIQVQNQQISIKGTRNGLLPTLDAVATLNNNALAGQPSDLPVLAGRTRSTPAFFIGGYGTVLSQLFSRNFPDYAIGFSLNIPLRNRSAQADMVNDQLTLRQQQLSLLRQENQVRVDVQNAVIALQQARAQVVAAVKARVLQEQTVDAEQKKYELGASTIYNVILAQRDLATAQSTEVSAMSNYSRSRVELDRVTGQTLNSNNISLAEAVQGKVTRPPDRIPSTTPQQ
jgi:outer membrane protein